MLHRLGSLWWKNTSACVLVFSELISGINDDIVSVLDISLFQSMHTHHFEKLWGTEIGDQRGVNGSWSKFILKSICRPISQNHHELSRVLGEVWNSYGRAKSTQNTPRTCERKPGSERENLQTCQTQTGQTALSNRLDRSGWSSKTQIGFRDRSDRLHPDRSQTMLQTQILSKQSPNPTKLGG